MEGGNTFWLAHCIEENDWFNLLVDAVVGTGGDEFSLEDEDSSMPAMTSSIPAVYIGKSAGAIMAGKYVETATWKGWDDPSVVPGMEEYDDWMGVKGLNLGGERSFFPHMSPDWEELVESKKEGILTMDKQCNKDSNLLRCLQEDEAFCIDGDKSFLAST